MQELSSVVNKTRGGFREAQQALVSLIGIMDAWMESDGGEARQRGRGDVERCAARRPDESGAAEKLASKLLHLAVPTTRQSSSHWTGEEPSQ